MIECDDFDIRLAPDSGDWEVLFDVDRFSSPRRLWVGDREILEDCGFYIDKMTDDSVIVDKIRAFRKGGCAVVNTEGHFPFGYNIGIKQSCKFASNHMRVTVDLQWKKGATVKRHLGVAGCFLPGRWKRWQVLPCSSRIVAGCTPEWSSLKDIEKGTMIGHWHRPPLAMVFEADNGTLLEIGTGSDVWRWENCAGAGPENGSYKVIVEENGIRIVRELLMTCQEFEPAPQSYRLSWYAAWQDGKHKVSVDKQAVPVTVTNNRELALEGENPNNSWLLNMTQTEWPDNSCRCESATDYVREKRSENPCLNHSAIQKRVRKLVRKLVSAEEGGRFSLVDVNPGICFDPVHVERQADDGLVHWDINGWFDLAEWSNNKIGDKWKVYLHSSTPMDMPSVNGLFANNGFYEDDLPENDWDDEEFE